MNNIEEIVQAAREAGLSYGYYVALFYDPAKATPTSRAPKQREQKPRKFTDAEAFRLWRDGMSDQQIANAVGVSRIRICQWRDQLELPSTKRTQVDTQKYRLATLQDGTVIAIKTDAD